MPMLGEVVPRLLEQLGGVQQRLGRDAADVEAGAAMRRALLDHGDLQAELRGADGADIAAGAGADDDEIVGAHCHSAGSLSFIADTVRTDRAQPAWRSPRSHNHSLAHAASVSTLSGCRCLIGSMPTPQEEQGAESGSGLALPDAPQRDRVDTGPVDRHCARALSRRPSARTCDTSAVGDRRQTPVDRGSVPRHATAPQPALRDPAPAAPGLPGSP